MIFSDNGINWDYESGFYTSSAGHRVHENDIPDPDKLFAARLNANSIKRDTPEAELLRPNSATYKLWEHKNADINT